MLYAIWRTVVESNVSVTSGRLKHDEEFDVLLKSRNRHNREVFKVLAKFCYIGDTIGAKGLQSIAI